MLFAGIVACGGSQTGPAGAPGPQGAQGEAGPAGLKGSDGKDGVNGAPGKDAQGTAPTRITRTYSCSKLGHPDGGLDHHFKYDLAEFSDGFVFVSGMASGLYYSTTEAMFFAPQQVGYPLAPIFLVGSSSSVLSTVGVWSWHLSVNRDTNTFVVQNAQDQVVVSQTCMPNVY
jgi:hypothetical protein